jgi:drug/metabolite transporter (DMT)-like permease
VGSLLAFLSAVSYSFMYVFVRTGVRPGDPDGGAFVTTLVNAVLLGGGALLVAAIAGPPTIALGGLAGFAAAGFFGTFLGRMLLFGAVHRIGPVRSAAISNMAPFVTVTIAVVFIGEHLSPSGFAAVGLLAAGLVLLVDEAYRSDRGPRRAAEADPVLWAVDAGAQDEGTILTRTQEAFGRVRRSVATPAMIGLAFATASAVAFGLSRSSRKIGIELMPDPLFGAMVGATVALGLIAIREGTRGRLGLLVGTNLRDPRLGVWVAGLMSTVGLLTFFLAIAYAPLAHVVVIAASETVITLVLGAIVLGRAERLSARVVAAALCVFGAGVLMALNQ